jgi:hypothetical protein
MYYFILHQAQTVLLIRYLSSAVGLEGNVIVAGDLAEV